MANLKDVAKKAGVSIATVSRVINDMENVDPKTALRVKNVIRDLNYKPSRVAQQLRNSTNKSKFIGLILPDIQNPFYIDVIKGVEELVYKEGYAVVVGNYSQEEEKAQLYIDIFRSESIGGFIIAPVPGSEKKVEKLIESGNSVVCVDRGLDNVSIDLVLTDNETGAFTAVDHLAKLGHKRIAHICGSEKIPTTQQRIKGYTKALRNNNIEVEESLIIGKDSTQKSGMEMAEKLLSMPNPPTAIFTGNNLLTMGALETIQKRGLNIPNDVAVVGFDDMPWSYALNPPLTAVRQSGFEVGHMAAEILLQRIKNPSRPVAKIMLDTKLVVRNSCGAKKENN